MWKSEKCVQVEVEFENDNVFPHCHCLGDKEYQSPSCLGEYLQQYFFQPLFAEAFQIVRAGIHQTRGGEKHGSR